MRAIFHPFEEFSENILIKDEQAKHLQVVRIKNGESVLILNGKGAKAFATVGMISKNSVELVVSKIETEKAKHGIHLAIAVPKKDAFEDVLKMAAELGVVSIQPLTSDFSQYEFQAGERISRILESALIQSNNAFLPKILPQIKLDTFLLQNKKPLYFFNSRPAGNEVDEGVHSEVVILIGPEGGFSEKETALIIDRPAVMTIHMPTPIQRAPTAVASSIGYLLARLRM
jgi:16S rRNA (uracil1498-N3)-methyltransferase